MALPWTLPDPDRPASNGLFNCPTCKEGEEQVAPAIRASWHCGYMPRAEWAPGRDAMPKDFGGQPYLDDTCPGYLVRSEDVIEATRAYAALEAHALDRFDPRGSRVVTEAAMLMQRAFNIHAAEKQRRNAARIGSR